MFKPKVKIFVVISSLLAVIALAGCDSSIETSIVVIEEGKASTTVSVTLDELTTEALLSKPNIDQQIMSTMSTISNQPVERIYSDNFIVYKVRSIPSEIPGDIVGVSNVAVGSKGDNLVTSMTLTDPTRLKEALDEAFKEEPDGQALSLTWKKSIKLKISVQTPGPIILYSPEFNVKGNQATFDKYLADWPDGKKVSIESEPSKFPLGILVVVLTSILVITAVLVTIRRRLS